MTNGASSMKLAPQSASISTRNRITGSNTRAVPSRGASVTSDIGIDAKLTKKNSIRFRKSSKSASRSTGKTRTGEISEAAYEQVASAYWDRSLLESSTCMHQWKDFSRYLVDLSKQHSKYCMNKWLRHLWTTHGGEYEELICEIRPSSRPSMSEATPETQH